MAASFKGHVDAELAEKYSMAKLSARRVAEVDEHILVCESCRQIISESDAFVAAMKNAAGEVRKTARKSRLRVVGK